MGEEVCEGGIGGCEASSQRASVLVFSSEQEEQDPNQAINERKVFHMNEWVLFGIVVIGSVLALGGGSWIVGRLGRKKEDPKG